MKRIVILWLLLWASSGAEEAYKVITIESEPTGAQVWLSQLDKATDTGQKTGPKVRLERDWFFDPGGNPVGRTLLFRLPGHDEASVKVNWGNLNPSTPLSDGGKPFRLPPQNLYYAALDHYWLSAAGLLALGLLVAGTVRQRSQTAQARRVAEERQREAEAARLRALDEEARQQAQRLLAEQARKQAQEEGERARQQEAVLAAKQQDIQNTAGKDPWAGIEFTSARVGTYRVSSLLGSGGMGSVYEGVLVRGKPISPPKLALKIVDLQKKPAARERAISEGQVGMQIVHPSIVRCYDYIETPEAVCLFQELVEGKLTLQSRVQTGGLPPELALTMLWPLAEALKVMHSKGYIHRDIKPDNVMIDAQGALKIADLGLAKNPHANFQTDSKDTLGTFAYCAPEQIANSSKVNGQADQYSLGCVLYEVIAGNLPFVRNDFIQYASAHMYETPPPIAKLSAETNQKLLKMLEKEPTQRYPDPVQAFEAVKASLGP